jgi:hypothetical protein
VLEAGGLRVMVDPHLSAEVGDIWIEAAADGLALRSANYGAGC